MTDLVPWLLAQIADDEAAARAATPGPWRWADPGESHVKQALVNDGWPYERYILPVAHSDLFPAVEDAVHIARHDPARVLADCAAKRAIVETCQADIERTGQDQISDGWVPLDPVPGWHILRLLAQPYADREGFDPKWRP